MSIIGNAPGATVYTAAILLCQWTYHDVFIINVYIYIFGHTIDMIRSIALCPVPPTVKLICSLKHSESFNPLNLHFFLLKPFPVNRLFLFNVCVY